MQTRLVIFGIKILISSDNAVSDWIRHDYFGYVSDRLFIPDVCFDLFLEKPDYSGLPSVKASGYHDSYIVYDSKDLRFVDFFGDALIKYLTSKRTVKIYCSSRDRLYDIFCLSFETLLGELLDKRSFHRVHCLGIEKGGRAALLLLPPGGGKTTLAFRFMEAGGYGVLSDDMVLYRCKNVYGVHFRWGSRDLKKLSEGRLMKSKDYPDKVLISTKHLKLKKSAAPGLMIVGHRISSRKSAIRKIGRLSLIMPLFKSMVLGLELQQSLAFFLLRNFRDGFSKAGIGSSRLASMVSLMLKSRAYEFRMGYDAEKNYLLLKEFLDREL